MRTLHHVCALVTMGASIYLFLQGKNDQAIYAACMAIYNRMCATDQAPARPDKE